MSAERELREHLLAAPLQALCAEAVRLREAGHGPRISFSPKVFIPLTRLCRDVCHYCTFATTPRRVPRPYLTEDEVLAIARAGERAGCTEALFTLGDKPELRYPEARAALDVLGCASTIDYLARMCEAVLRETSLLPHANPGVATREEIARLRDVSVSQGLMLESSSERLCAPGGVHHGSPDKHPATRLATLRAAGELAVPMTSGLLIGIGETREERLDALFVLRDLHAAHGHLQEVIIQNFRAKPATKMAGAPEPELTELRWTIAAARHVLGATMNIQAPPNLSPTDHAALIASGINDWGGISPVTPDHVNPEAPWPHVETLRATTESCGATLVERLPVYPAYVRDAARWIAPALASRLMRAADTEGYARADAWSPGLDVAPPVRRPSSNGVSAAVRDALARASGGERLDEPAIAALFAARGADFDAVCERADAVRRETVGDDVAYVVNRNLNYTNVCAFRCHFCAFSKATRAAGSREAAYDLDPGEIARRVREAVARGATEVCMQGGIHPRYTGETYLALLDTVKSAAPSLHVHAFSPLEVTHGARTLGLAVPDFLERLRAAGLGTLPGTAAEILDDAVRAVICPDKLSTDEWLAVVEAAHRAGLRTTATIMFGHVESSVHQARHLLAIRDLQARTGGFTEIVPLPFVHMEAPLAFRGAARKGPTWREAILMHAVARLALHPLVPNVQVSWVKLGAAGVRAALAAGANDLGGTLMNESISHAAGTAHAEELPPAEMDALIRSAGRTPRQRTTLYGAAPEPARVASYRAAPLAPVVLTPLARRARPTAGALE